MAGQPDNTDQGTMYVSALIRNTDRAGRRPSGHVESRGASTAPRHGIAERGRSNRHRFCHRDRGTSEPIIHRAHALDAMPNRLEAVERTQRMHARTIGQMHETHHRHRQVTSETSGDIAARKVYVGKTFENMDSFIKNRFGEFRRVIDTTINDNLNLLIE